MKYVPPYGREAEGDSASYINGDPSIARQGSIPPAAAFENPMRELVNVITDSMLTPSDTDLEQVAKGIRSQRMNYAYDTGSVNTLSVAFDPPMSPYTIGLPIRVLVQNTNTGPSTIDAGAGRVSIKRPTGSQVAAGDLPAGGLIDLVYDGTSFQMINFGGGGGTGGATTYVNIPYTVDTSPTPNTVIANFSPAVTTLIPGTILMVKIANTNTTFTNINVNGLGNKQVYAQGSSSPNWPLLPSDLVVGDVLIFVYDGTRFWIYANTILNQSATFNVTTTAQINDLFTVLGRKRILSGLGFVTVQLATGIYSPFVTYHPDAENIQVRGTMLAANPGINDFARTGSSPASRAADSANNIVMLRSRYGSEIRFTNSNFNGAVRHDGPGSISFVNLLVTGQNVFAGATSVTAVIGICPAPGASIFVVGCTVWGSGGYGIYVGGGTCQCGSSFASGNWNAGFGSSFASTMVLSGCGSFGNDSSGINVDTGSSLSAVWRMGVAGLPDSPPSVIQCNNIGIVSTGGSSCDMDHAVIQSNAAVDIYALNDSVVSLHNATAGTASPPSNTVGNNNSIVTTTN